jgi:hypothetical protein
MPLNHNPFDDFPEAAPIDGRGKAASREPRKPKQESQHSVKVACTFMVDADVKQQLRLLSCVTNESQQNLVNEALTDLLAKHSRQLPKVAA